MSRQRMSEARRNVPSRAFELRKWRGPRHLLSLRGGEADQIIVRIPPGSAGFPLDILTHLLKQPYASSRA
jgi:hypothetical protein